MRFDSIDCTFHPFNYNFLRQKSEKFKKKNIEGKKKKQDL